MPINDNPHDGSVVKEIANLVHQKPEISKLSRGQHIILVGDKHHIIGEPFLPEPQTIHVSTLKGVADYVNAVKWPEGHEVFIHVVSPTEVRVISPEVGPEKQTFTYIEANAKVPVINLGDVMGVERLIVMLHTCFLPTQERETVLQYVGGLTAGLATEVKDNGVSQEVTARKGITQIDNAKLVPSPVNLGPFRTFHEVAQPESAFILRITSKNNAENAMVALAGLFEADGGQWEGAAIDSIGAYFRANCDLPVLA